MIGAGSALLLLAGCGAPDPQALQKLACQQVANTIDLQSVAQLDTLRKALGLAPGVDPIASCRALGVPMEPGAAGEAAGQNGAGGASEAGESEGGAGESEGQ